MKVSETLLRVEAELYNRIERCWIVVFDESLEPPFVGRFGESDVREQERMGEESESFRGEAE